MKSKIYTYPKLIDLPSGDPLEDLFDELDKAIREELEKEENKPCRCKYGSIMTSTHPCKNGCIKNE